MRNLTFTIPVIYSNFCKRLKARSSSQAIYVDRILYEIRRSEEYHDYVTGTSIPNLDVNGLLESRPIVIPTDDILSKFASIMCPIYQRLYSHESSNLASIRDALLPKLLSGEIRIKDAEKLVGEVV